MTHHDRTGATAALHPCRRCFPERPPGTLRLFGKYQAQTLAESRQVDLAARAQIGVDAMVFVEHRSPRKRNIVSANSRSEVGVSRTNPARLRVCRCATSRTRRTCPPSFAQPTDRDRVRRCSPHRAPPLPSDCRTTTGTAAASRMEQRQSAGFHPASLANPACSLHSGAAERKIRRTRR